MDKSIIIVLIAIGLLTATAVAINHNRTEINKLKQPQTRECNAPQNCATEIYGDQF